MTFRHIEALDALVDHTRRCFADVEAVLPEAVLCTVTVQPHFVGRQARTFEAEARLVGRTIAADVRHVSTDLFESVSGLVATLRERVQPRHSGVWALDAAAETDEAEPGSQVGEDGRA